MKYLPIFALFLVFACCEEISYPVQCICVEQFSDALPIQIWPADCDTYNETDPSGVHYKCFCQPWKCDDEIPFQFTNTELNDYNLVAYDEDDNILQEIPFIVTSPEVINNGDFSDGLNGWTQTSFDATQTRSFSAVGGRAQATIINNVIINNNTKVIGQTVINANTDYYLSGTAFLQANSNVSIGLRLYITLYSGSTVINEILLHTFSQTVDVYGFTNFLIDSADLTGADSIGFRFYLTSSSIEDTDVSLEDISLLPVNGLYIYNASFTPADHGVCEEKIKFIITSSESPESVGKTDCMDISDSDVDPTVLISYSNNRNFAGLIYENVSPAQEFNIRVPAVFFHERFPEEDEAIELSDSRIINLNGVVRAQRLLDTAYMPYYMHRKLKLVFKHNNVSIDGLAITKQDAYEIEEGDRRWPVKKAKCWLTERDFVQRNVV